MRRFLSYVGLPYVSDRHDFGFWWPSVLSLAGVGLTAATPFAFIGQEHGQ